MCLQPQLQPVEKITIRLSSLWISASIECCSFSFSFVAFNVNFDHVPHFDIREIVSHVERARALTFYEALRVRGETAKTVERNNKETVTIENLTSFPRETLKGCSKILRIRFAREAAAVYARRYTERQQPYYNFFTKLKLRLQTHGQFKPIKRAGIFISSW